ncbi:MAG: YigZ family protein [Phototrophicales bacterium]|nr:MAG: YigZ family protein [Phototrophicales bacterium]
MTEPYLIPNGFHRIETEVARSRFIASVEYTPTVDNAKAFLGQIRAEMPDASHHVYAFRVGYGASVIEGMSDDGEPAGTAGPPVLAVLRGSKIGDIAIVVTRYFGGTKLGTGGLVRAYSEAAHVALNSLATTLKIEKRLLGIEIPYSLYNQAKLLIEAHHGTIEEELFEANITLMIRFALDDIPRFTDALRDLSHGKITPVELG